ncbi:Achaete-scute-like protein 3 [Plecturocebus cupreus]
MENKCEESSELGFRRWIIRNFCELKEYVLNQCKETNNFEKRFDEMLRRMDNFENINELMELKNTIGEIREVCTSFNSRIDQAEERILEVEDQLNEMKREDKIREKRVKRNEQNLQEIWDYVKRPNVRLIGIPESDEENESKLESIFQGIIQENFPKLARHDNTQLQAIQRTPQRYSSRRPTPRHIIVRFTRIEIKEKILRAAREKGQVTHKGKPIRLTADLLFCCDPTTALKLKLGPGGVAHACNLSTLRGQGGQITRGQEFETSLANMVGFSSLNTALGEAEAGGLPEPRSLRPAWATWHDSVPTTNTKLSQVKEEMMDNRSNSSLPDKLPIFSNSACLPMTRAFYLEPTVTFHLHSEAPVPSPYSEELPRLPFPSDSPIMGNYGEPCPFSFPMPYPNYRRCEYSYGPAFIRKRNERERQRVKCVNEGYAQLRHHLPEEYLEKRLSKVETLRAAIKYINYLQSLLYPDKAKAKNNPGKCSSMIATTSHHADSMFRIVPCVPRTSQEPVYHTLSITLTFTAMLL